MIAARWADATVGGDRLTDHPAYAQDSGEMTVTKASKILKVGERGIYHARNVLENSTPEAVAAVETGPADRVLRDYINKCAEIQLW